MSLRALMSQPLVVQSMTPTGSNGYGEPTLAPNGSPVNVLGYLEQERSNEFLVDRETTVTQWIAYLPAATAITRLDYISFQSQTFQVEGEPEHCYNPRTQVVSHIRCNLLVVTG